MQRFYDPDQGRLVVVYGDDDVDVTNNADGSDLQDVPLTCHRRRLAVVAQDPVLFHGSLYDNVVYGQPQKKQQQRHSSDDDEPTEQMQQWKQQQERRVKEALRLAHADEFVATLPDGVTTQVGEKGVQLSGGQRQRLALARAIYNDCNFLILDEATSALDGNSENAIQAALDEWMAMAPKVRVILIIAHRLRTIRNANQIVVLQEGGVIAENGTHEELWRLNGLYRKMVEDSNNHNQGRHDDLLLV
jgi:ABC-type multidrug transport system fused ATPase/permease subunit